MPNGLHGALSRERRQAPSRGGVTPYLILICAAHLRGDEDMIDCVPGGQLNRLPNALLNGVLTGDDKS